VVSLVVHALQGHLIPKKEVTMLDRMLKPFRFVEKSKYHCYFLDPCPEGGRSGVFRGSFGEFTF
jgi:hypothetical protein